MAEGTCISLNTELWLCLAKSLNLPVYLADPMSGGTQDWAKGVLGVKYPFLPELRGGGFDPPASEIQPSYEEMWNGIVAYADDIYQHDHAP